MEIILENLLLIKALHIIAVICWMCGLLYLPRLFVYHAQVKVNSEAYKIFETMELKLMRIIMNPSMILAFVLGLLMLFAQGMGSFGKWMHVKLLLVFMLAGIHGYLAYCRKQFALHTNTKSEKFYRIINEIPAVIMFIIVILAVMKPF
jgi:protoporphyrinogen IX oxidase